MNRGNVRRKGGRGGGRKRGARGRRGGTRLMVVGGRFAVPPRTRAKLCYSKTVAITNATFGYANVRFSPTNAYDVDPVLGSTAMPFFTEYNSMYRRYRTVSAVITVNFANLDLVAYTAYVTADNQDPGANTANYAPQMSNRMSRHCVLGLGTGDGNGRLRLRASTSDFGGVRNTLQDDNYSALAGNSPTNNWWFNVGVLSTGAIANGVHADINIDVIVDFYEIGTLPT